MDDPARVRLLERLGDGLADALWIWSAKGRARVCRGYAPTTETGVQAYAPSFSADGRAVAAGGWTGALPVARLPRCARVWDLQSGAVVTGARAAALFADSYAATKTVWSSEAGLYWAARDASHGLVLWRGISPTTRRRR